MYEKELNALRASHRLRQRCLYDERLIDCASNDYLGLSARASLLKGALKRLKKLAYHSPKASLLVNGYSPLHAEFEALLMELNGFEGAILLGSGFLANIALIESLVRANDRLFIDEDYHASGKLAARLLGDRVSFFRHNDPEHLESLLRAQAPKGRILIAIEGVYSMSGAIARREFATLADQYGAILIVDEAHSSGTIGDRLLGYFDYHHLAIQPHYIKMGTLSKAYASYGAYILASPQIIAFLENRAKSVIYTTALSLLDTALAMENLLYIQAHREKLARRLQKRQRIAQEILHLPLQSPILAYPIASSPKLLRLSRDLLEAGFLVGAIRPPTVSAPLLRVILRASLKKSQVARVCEAILRLEKEGS